MTTTDSRQARDIDESTLWSAADLAQIRNALQLDLDRLQHQVALAAHDFGTHVGEFVTDLGDEVIDISALMVELNEGSSVANNDKVVLHQTQRALLRIDTSMYGSCEGCAQPIPKERLIALPRATHCITCQSSQSTS